MNINAQYMGFKAKATVREYKFSVSASSIDPYEITFAILNEAFTSRRLSFQDAPDICSLKLHRELAVSADSPLKASYRITEAELDAYHESHAPKAARGFYKRKSEQDS